MKLPRLILQAPATARSRRYLALVARIFGERTGAAPPLAEPGAEPTAGDLVLALDPAIGAEGYRIESLAAGALLVAGNDEVGLLHGIGRLLHDASWEGGAFAPGPWRGSAIPTGSIRGMYFAFHNNWYSKAPIAEINEYVEELALWGMNSLVLHLQQFEDTNSAAARADFARNSAILKSARELGLRVGLLKVPNLGFEIASEEVPAQWLAPEFPDTDPARRGFAGVRLCPSQPEAFAYLSHKLDQYLSGYESIGLDFVVAFPYDSGGCGCADCWPWGARGYVTICKEFSRLARAHYPGCKFVLGTWCFDVREESDGEYEGLEEVLAHDKSWVDAIMADAHEEFPPYPLQPGSLAGLPLINFAEISMWGRFPWGGSGANPLPQRFQELWDATGARLDGGFPYSEGKFEDINKAIFLQFFFDRTTTAQQTVRDYVRYEFGTAAADEIIEAISLLETTYPSWQRHQADAVRAYELIMAANARLSARAAQSWRWQLILQRAIIDFETVMHPDEITARRNAAYEALVVVSHLQDGWQCVTPRAPSYLAHRAAQEAAEGAAALAAAPELPPGAEPERDAAARAERARS